MECKRFLVIVLIILCFSSTLGFSVENQHTGEILLTVFPDMSMQLEMDFEGEIESEEAPFSSISSNVAFHPIDSESTDYDLDIIVKMPLEYALLLTGLNLNININQNGLDSNGTINAGMFGMADINGYFSFETNEYLMLSKLTIEGNISLWHTFIETEFIQSLLTTFPQYKEELSNQIISESQGNLTLTEFDIVEYWNMTDHSKLWMKLIIDGDWSKAALAISSNSMDEFSSPNMNMDPLFSQTSNIEIRYDKVSYAFIIEGSGRYLGNFNSVVNDLKNQGLEQAFEDSSKNTKAIIQDILIPLELDLTSFSLSFNIIASSPKSSYTVAINKFNFTPVNASSVLKAIQSVSEDISEEGYTLIIEGGSHDEKSVEIIVPEETTTPQIKEPHMVEWKFTKLENLDKVTFKVDDDSEPGDNLDDSTDTGVLKPEYIVPVAVILGAVILLLFLRRK